MIPSQIGAAIANQQVLSFPPLEEVNSRLRNKWRIYKQVLHGIQHSTLPVSLFLSLKKKKKKKKINPVYQNGKEPKLVYLWYSRRRTEAQSAPTPRSPAATVFYFTQAVYFLFFVNLVDPSRDVPISSSSSSSEVN